VLIDKFWWLRVGAACTTTKNILRDCSFDLQRRAKQIWLPPKMYNGFRRRTDHFWRHLTNCSLYKSINKGGYSKRSTSKNRGYFSEADLLLSHPGQFRIWTMCMLMTYYRGLSSTLVVRRGLDQHIMLLESIPPSLG